MFCRKSFTHENGAVPDQPFRLANIIISPSKRSDPYSLAAVSVGSGRPEMLQPKTHFEQIPLETVKKIVDEQLRQEAANEAPQLERFQVVASGVSEQAQRPVIFDAAFLPSKLRPKQVASVQESTFTNVANSLSGTPPKMKHGFARRASRQTVGQTFRIRRSRKCPD